MPSSVEIQNNTLLGRNANVLLIGYGKGKHKWAVQYNNLIAGVEGGEFLTNKAFNVYYLNAGLLKFDVFVILIKQCK